MVTRIEIGSYIEERYQSANGPRVKLMPQEETFQTLLEVGDNNGKYETALGCVGVEFSMNENGHRLVTFDIRNIKLLQTRSNREKRSVNVSNEGVGTTILSPGRILRVKTDASFENK